MLRFIFDVTHVAATLTTKLIPLHPAIKRVVLFYLKMVNTKYEAVIGLEVHAQLATKSKLFSGDSAAFGGEANTHISPITMGHPGTLPKTNKKAVEYAIRMGLACNCTIERFNYFARKNYFYPDLPKGYQVSQHTTPICKGGFVTITTLEGERQVRLNRIHMEEDAGKSIHDGDADFTCVDLNRAGVPLIEIVTEPDMHSAEEAFQYVTEVRKLVKWIGVCDGNMEEGSLRCDANVSIRLKGETELGVKVEVKNLNSIRNVKKAIEYEIERMIMMAEKGEQITQQTRSFNADNDTTFSIRDKEEANDYRYFPEPDLTPFHLTDDYISSIKEAMPELPEALVKRFEQEFLLPLYDARQLCDDKTLADYFIKVVKHTQNYKAVANWILGPLKQYTNVQHVNFDGLSLSPETLAAIVNLVDNGKVNFSVASQKVLPVLLQGSDKTPLEIATHLNLLQVSDNNEIDTWVNEVLNKMPDKVSEYKKGKKGLIGLFVGEVKKLSKGKADPKIVTSLLEERLK